MLTQKRTLQIDSPDSASLQELSNVHNVTVIRQSTRGIRCISDLSFNFS